MPTQAQLLNVLCVRATGPHRYGFLVLCRRRPARNYKYRDGLPLDPSSFSLHFFSTMEKDPSMANDQNDSEAESKFDPSCFEHIKLGVWDLYIMRTRLLRYLPTSRKIEEYTQIWKDIPYLWRTLRDMSTVA